MIKNTFLFLPKIRQKKELSIWKQGIKDWDSFLGAEHIVGISTRRKNAYDKEIKEAKNALFNDDSSYFNGRLPQHENWRLYESFREDAVFLDIEASSATSPQSYLTVIGMFDGIDTKVMIRGINMDIGKLKEHLEKYRIIITFNGSVFDIPYLNRKYPGTISRTPVIDLRHVCAKIGLKGGLKDIEKALGIKRANPIVDRLYGGDPLKLWRMFRGSGDDYYLKLLIEYNEEDVINLKKIAEYSIHKLTQHHLSYSSF